MPGGWSSHGNRGCHLPWVFINLFLKIFLAWSKPYNRLYSIKKYQYSPLYFIFHKLLLNIGHKRLQSMGRRANPTIIPICFPKRKNHKELATVPKSRRISHVPSYTKYPISWTIHNWAFPESSSIQTQRLSPLSQKNLVVARKLSSQIWSPGKPQPQPHPYPKIFLPLLPTHLLCIARMHPSKALVSVDRARRLPKGLFQRVQRTLKCTEIDSKPSNDKAVAELDVWSIQRIPAGATKPLSCFGLWKRSIGMVEKITRKDKAVSSDRHFA